MLLIIGLGNPDKKYQKTRHNIGFRIVDAFAEKNNFLDFELNKKLESLISENVLNNEKIILAKPQTFMNNSGKAAQKIVKNLPVKSLKILVVHDDIDIEIGKIKISENRGSAGHKGVQSIIDELKTKNFTRLRIGIRQPNQQRKITEEFVLRNFAQNEEKILKQIIDQACLKISEKC
ncbi:MAG: aminoacyl-tRNA hydrolase [Patescibacteria group bacterium]|nr:aminoacyl-tRNA hydrolase [Patescibacteria group bacterium]